jgi:hypothetical protein
MDFVPGDRVKDRRIVRAVRQQTDQGKNNQKKKKNAGNFFAHVNEVQGSGFKGSRLWFQRFRVAYCALRLTGFTMRIARCAAQVARFDYYVSAAFKSSSWLSSSP